MKKIQSLMAKYVIVRCQSNIGYIDYDKQFSLNWPGPPPRIFKTLTKKICTAKKKKKNDFCNKQTNWDPQNFFKL